MAKNKYIPLNCSKCGRFVGKDGFHDVGYDYYNGGYDVGYPLCKKCLDKCKEYYKLKELKQGAKNTEQQVQVD